MWVVQVRWLSRHSCTCLPQLNHPNIVKIFDVYEDDARVVIIEELVDGGELFKRIVKLVWALCCDEAAIDAPLISTLVCEQGAYSEAMAREYIRDITLGMAHCHGANIAHRDLKVRAAMAWCVDLVLMCAMPRVVCTA